MQEVADGHAATPAAWTLRRGRQLLIGPAWAESEERVVFDACSGDYWMLDGVGHRIVRSMMDAVAPVGAEAVARAAETADADQLASAIEWLSGTGLIEPTRVSALD